MTKTRWFEIDLHTLQLGDADLGGWPEEMAGEESRMQEECLESVVAFNLDLLFPGEDLLLIGVRSMGWRTADVLALDPLGVLRLMELKKTPVRMGDLQDQIVSYGIIRSTVPAWDHLIARDFFDLPERIELSLEGFRVNARTQILGEKYVTTHTPDALHGLWRKRNRFDKAHLVADALRASRGAPPGPVALENPKVNEVLARLYGVPFTGDTLEGPDGLLARIEGKKWGTGRPTVRSIEFAVIAAELPQVAASGIALEKRGACFYLIDAELRHTGSDVGVKRAILRWEPVHRTARSTDVRTAMALRKRLLERHPHAASFWWDPRPPRARLYWHDLRESFLRVEESGEGQPILVTRADGLTEGYADLRPVRAAALRKLRGPLEGLGVVRKGAELAAPWDRKNLKPAVELAAAYFDMLQELGFFDLEKYRWERRPSSKGG